MSEKINTKVDALWTLNDIATYLKKSKQTVEKVVVTQPTFPKRISSLGDRTIHPLWFPDEVIAWVKEQQDVA